MIDFGCYEYEVVRTYNQGVICEETAYIIHVCVYIFFQMFEPFQSRFLKWHIAKTIMVNVSNDLLMTSDTGAISILILLDLSSAFDTVEHTLLLNHLEKSLVFLGSPWTGHRSEVGPV